MDGGDATPNRRNLTGYPHPASFNPQALAQDDSQHFDKRIGVAGYEPWVYQFSYEAMDPVNGYRSPTGANYGWHPSNTYP
jgi:hypothetical protein